MSAIEQGADFAAYAARDAELRAEEAALEARIADLKARQAITERPPHDIPGVSLSYRTRRRPTAWLPTFIRISAVCVSGQVFRLRQVSCRSYVDQCRATSARLLTWPGPTSTGSGRV